MEQNSYPIIDVSKKTLAIMKFIGNSQMPVSTKTIESEFNMKYATVMTHVATLETEGLIERKEGGYVAAMELAKIWALKRAQNERRRRMIENEYRILGGNEDGAE